MAAKKALRSDPAARASQLAALNAKQHARHYQAALNDLIGDFIGDSVTLGVQATEPVTKATAALTQIRQASVYRTALKAHRAGRVYPSDGNAAHAASRYQPVVAVEVAA